MFLDLNQACRNQRIKVFLYQFLKENAQLISAETEISTRSMQESYLHSLTGQKLKHKLNLRSLLEMQAAEVFFYALRGMENDCYFLNEKVAFGVGHFATLKRKNATFLMPFSFGILSCI